MTFEKLKQIIEKNNIPEDVTLMSDSGWECCATKMDGVYYNECENVMVFTQTGDKYEIYHQNPLLKQLWKQLHGEEIEF